MSEPELNQPVWQSALALFDFVEGTRNAPLGATRLVRVVGHNGAGKTTLLRAMAGLYEPVREHVWRRGRTASLLNVSLGIDDDATGCSWRP